MRYRWWIAAAVLAGLGGCLGDGDGIGDAVPLPGRTELYFDVTYHNEAWGYRLEGWYVDGRGNLYAFDHSGTPWTADADTIPEADLLEKFGCRRTFVGRVPPAQLAAMAALVPAAAGEIEPPVSECADAGVTTDQAWIRLPGRRAYARVLINQRGDFYRRNTAPAAATLHAWLSGLIGQGAHDCEP